MPVPNVVGMPLAEAQATLGAGKLNAEVTMQPVPEPQRNDVVLASETSPAGKTLSRRLDGARRRGQVHGARPASPCRTSTGCRSTRPRRPLRKAKLNAVRFTMQAVHRAAANNNVVLRQQRPRRHGASPRVSQVPASSWASTRRPAQQPVPNVAGMTLDTGQADTCADKAQRRRHDGKGDRQKQKQGRSAAAFAAGSSRAAGSQVPLSSDSTRQTPRSRSANRFLSRRRSR